MQMKVSPGTRSIISANRCGQCYLDVKTCLCFGDRELMKEFLNAIRSSIGLEDLPVQENRKCYEKGQSYQRMVSSR